MTALIATPILDEGLQQSPEQFHARFTVAKSLLQEAVEKKTIYNADYEQAKGHLASGVERGLNPLVNAWYAVMRDNVSAEQLQTGDRPDVHQYCQFNQAVATIRRNQKFLHIPEVARYNAALGEVVSLNNLLKEAKAVVVKGRKPAVEPTIVDLTNTAVCAICGRRQKLDKQGKLVHHGFQISNGAGDYFGQRIGSCFGVGHLPHELSNEANHAFDKLLHGMVGQKETALGRLQAGEITVLTRTKTEWKGIRKVSVVEQIEAGHEDFPKLLAREITQVQADIKGLHMTIEWNRKRTDDWKPQPLKYPRTKG